MNKYLALLTALIIPFLSKADETVEMASIMHENGKIYVVVGVLAIIFAGIVIYLISIDNKVSKLQKQLEEK
jgi:CcmD family protein